MANRVQPAQIVGLVVGMLTAAGLGYGVYKIVKGTVTEKRDTEKRERSPYVEVIHPGGTVLRVGDTISWHTLDVENERTKRWGGAPAEVKELPGGYRRSE